MVGPIFFLSGGEGGEGFGPQKFGVPIFTKNLQIQIFCGCQVEGNLIKIPQMYTLSYVLLYVLSYVSSLLPRILIDDSR